jgi:hypothetical protein
MPQLECSTAAAAAAAAHIMHTVKAYCTAPKPLDSNAAAAELTCPVAPPTVWCLLHCCSNKAVPLLCGAPASSRALQGQEALLLLLLLPAADLAPAMVDKHDTTVSE